MFEDNNISRRQFLGTTTAATAATSFFPSPVSSSSNEPKKQSGHTFKIAAVQMNPLPEKLEYNIDIHRRIVKEAAQDGCALVMFPELSLTAHLGDASVTALAQKARKGIIFETMLSLAKMHRIIISYGFCEIARGANYNSHALIGPDGIIGIHRKVHPSRDEYTYFRMGRALDVFDIGICRIGILICYDANFFEAWRVLALKGAEMILLPHAGRSGVGIEIAREKQNKQLNGVLDRLPGRYGVYAADNNVFAVYGNQVGYNGHSTHSGAAYILGPDGKLIAKSKPVPDDHWISAEIDMSVRVKRRNNPNSTLKDRRPEMYRELTKMV